MLPTSTSGRVKTLAISLKPCDFLDQLFEWLAGERNDGAIGMDGTALDVADGVAAAAVACGVLLSSMFAKSLPFSVSTLRRM